MLHDESGTQALGFKEMADELVNEARGSPGVGTGNLVLMALMVEEISGFLGCDILWDFFP